LSLLVEWNITGRQLVQGYSAFGHKGVQNYQTVVSFNKEPASVAPIYVSSDIYRRPAFGANHPLKIIRHAAVTDLARTLGWLDDDNFRASEPATVDQLLEFHDRAYIKALQYADSEARVTVDVRNRYQIGTLENPVFPGLFDRAAMTVGGSVLAAELALEGHVTFHPSGGTHHGRPDRACGFCYFNDPVFAILKLLESDVAHVLYIDLDAHHGDGVEEAFFEDQRVTTVSVHEDYRWPYSGTTSYPHERAFNLPVPRRFNDSELEYLVERAILPLATDSRVEALVICCGADCLAGDPLSTMMLSNVALWNTVDTLVGLGHPTVIVGGGGYNPWTLTRYWAGLWGRINGQDIPETLPPEAAELLSGMECDLVDEDEIDPNWLTNMADSPYPGAVRDAIKLLADNIAA
jgi:acetoin utilization protein AcuC